MSANNLTDEQKKERIEDYNNGFTMKQMCEKYGKTKSGMRSFFLRNKIDVRDERKKYQANDSYFQIIDTEDKAYFLGLLYADGYNNEFNRIALCLNVDDIDIVEKFKQYLNSTNPIIIKINKNPKYKNTANFIVHGKKLSIDLWRHGCMENKTFKIEFPYFLDGELIKDFIRGYVDGDGYISKNVKDPEISLISTQNVCEGIKNHILSKLDVNSRISNGTHPKIKILRISGRNQVKRFLNYIYKNSIVYMDRKYKLYSKINDYDLRDEGPKKFRGKDKKPRKLKNLV